MTESEIQQEFEDYIQKCINRDNKYPDPINYFLYTNKVPKTEKVSPLIKISDLNQYPKYVLDRVNSAKKRVFFGSFPLIYYLYCIVDNCLILWSYEDPNNIKEIKEDSDELITVVEIGLPERYFSKNTSYVLLVATDKKVKLYPIYSACNIVEKKRTVCSTSSKITACFFRNTSEIFLGSDRGEIFFIKYSGFQDHNDEANDIPVPIYLEKISYFNWKSLGIRQCISWLYGCYSPIKQVVFDKTRLFLYTLNSDGVISLFQYDECSHTFVFCSFLCYTKPILSISAVPRNDSSRYILVGFYGYGKAVIYSNNSELITMDICPNSTGDEGKFVTAIFANHIYIFQAEKKILIARPTIPHAVGKPNNAYEAYNPYVYVFFEDERNSEYFSYFNSYNDKNPYIVDYLWQHNCPGIFGYLMTISGYKKITFPLYYELIEESMKPPTNTIIGEKTPDLYLLRANRILSSQQRCLSLLEEMDCRVVLQEGFLNRINRIFNPIKKKFQCHYPTLISDLENLRALYNAYMERISVKDSEVMTRLQYLYKYLDKIIQSLRYKDIFQSDEPLDLVGIDEYIKNIRNSIIQKLCIDSSYNEDLEQTCPLFYNSTIINFAKALNEIMEKKFNDIGISELKVYKDYIIKYIKTYNDFSYYDTIFQKYKEFVLESGNNMNKTVIPCLLDICLSFPDKIDLYINTIFSTEDFHEYILSSENEKTHYLFYEFLYENNKDYLSHIKTKYVEQYLIKNDKDGSCLYNYYRINGKYDKAICNLRDSIYKMKLSEANIRQLGMYIVYLYSFAEVIQSEMILDEVALLNTIVDSKDIIGSRFENYRIHEIFTDLFSLLIDEFKRTSNIEYFKRCLNLVYHKNSNLQNNREEMWELYFEKRIGTFDEDEFISLCVDFPKNYSSDMFINANLLRDGNSLIILMRELQSKSRLFSDILVEIGFSKLSVFDDLNSVVSKIETKNTIDDNFQVITDEIEYMRHNDKYLYMQERVSY